MKIGFSKVLYEDEMLIAVPDLIADLQEARKALEFYANRSNWSKEVPEKMHFYEPWTVAQEVVGE